LPRKIEEILSLPLTDKEIAMATSPSTPPAPVEPSGLDDATVLAKLGPLAGLAGTWQGTGFNIAARPDFQNRGDVVVERNLTSDALSFDPIPAVINNRGFAQPDIELFGLSYLQHSHDATSGWPIHIEPGMWINQPSTTQPPAEPPPGGQLVARMFSIPHGASFVAQGFALPFSGPPVISPGADPVSGSQPAFSSFPAFNSTPLRPAFPEPESAVHAAGTSATQAGSDGGLSAYTVAGAQRLPASITQQLVDDPVTLLQQQVEQQLAEGYRFEGVAVNVATTSTIPFDPQPVDVPQFGGGIANLGFLRGVSDQQPNLSVSLVYSTFWIEKLSHPDGRPPLVQLQYAQTALVDFPARSLPGMPNMSWPHVSVSTLQQALS
jgi:hypothetical protein